MDLSIIKKLTDINQQFYQSCAVSFSQTRQRVQPGVRRVISTYLPPFDPSHLLDLGCGNGDLLPALAEAKFAGSYTGLDFSTGLLQESNFQSDQFTIQFHMADITQLGWSEQLADKPFDLVLSYAVLHHIPAREVRQRLVTEIRSILNPNGYFIFSTWQFLRSPRLTRRIQPWVAVQINSSDVDEGDYLLDWRANEETGQALRYVHIFSQSELDELAADTGFTRVERFSSDGKEGNLSDYEIWKIAA